MLNFKLFTLILLAFLTINGYSQKKGSSKPQSEKALLLETFDDAEFFFEQEDYKEALYGYQKIYEKMPDNANILFKLGVCYVNIPGEEIKAIPYLEKASRKISIKYKKSTLEEKSAPLHLLYYLGNAYRINNQLDQALAAYNQFRNNPHFDGNYNIGMVENEISACERAKLIQDNPITIEISNLGPVINNANSNKRPVITRDENTIIYLSSLKFYDAIFMSRKIDGAWSEPQNISDQVGSDGDCEPVCISADGNELYLVKKTKSNNDLYVSRRDGDFWKPMKPLNKNINSPKHESSASISVDGKQLYFSSERRGSQGGLDIYVSEKQENGDWGPARNLGKTINTDLNENIPFICEDGKTLYFASEGNLSMGNYDIFVTSLLPNGKWDLAANIGYPVNTTGNDPYYLPLKNGEVAYTYLIKSEGLGQEDIYRIENITVKERNAKAAENYKYQPFKVQVKNKINNEVVGVLLYDKNPQSLKMNVTSEYIEVKVK